MSSKYIKITSHSTQGPKIFMLPSEFPYPFLDLSNGVIREAFGIKVNQLTKSTTQSTNEMLANWDMNC